MAEWATRIVVSYLACPAEGVDLTDEAGVRQLVRLFVLPGITPGLATRRLEASAPGRHRSGREHRPSLPNTTGSDPNTQEGKRHD